MRLRKASFIICLMLLFVSLVVGYGASNHWIEIVLSIVIVLGWLLAKINPDSGFPNVCLFATISLAVAGILLGCTPWLMICSSGFGLTVWDLVLLENALKNNSPDENARQFENKHLQTLGLALGAGLFIILPGRLLQFDPPFIVLLICIGLVLYGLDRVWCYMKKIGKFKV